MYELLDEPRLFVGFKIDSLTLRELRSLDAANAKYVSETESTFLTVANRGKERFVGKVLEEPLTTDRVDDVRRNVESILQRLLPDMRLPKSMDVLPWRETVATEGEGAADAADEGSEGRRW